MERTVAASRVLVNDTDLDICAPKGDSDILMKNSVVDYCLRPHRTAARNDSDVLIFMHGDFVAAVQVFLRLWNSGCSLRDVAVTIA
jgi:hypothetical protein